MLIADPTLGTPKELDLAEAICSLRWPNWPAYEGPLDIWQVHDALVGVPPLHIDTIHRLAAQPARDPATSRNRLPMRAQGP